MEKRLYERFSVPIKLAYELNARPRIVNESDVKNISGTGACIFLREKLLPMTALKITIGFQDKNDAIRLSGKVVWSRRSDASNGPEQAFNTGIEFDDPNPIGISRIISRFLTKA